MPSQRRGHCLTTRRATLAVLSGLAAVAASTRAGATAAQFDVVGRDLHWGGKPIRLAGVCVGDPIYIRPNRPADDFVAIREDWKANCVRISLHPGHWRQDRASAREALLRDVSLARAAGLFVIVDWHAIGFPGHFVEHPDPAWGLPRDAYASDEALATDFWATISRDLGRDPAILFELWNEPVVDGQLWRSTGEHWSLLTPLWQRLTAVIRVRSDNLVLVAGGRWAHDLHGVRTAMMPDARTIYAWHCYPAATKGNPHDWAVSLDGLARLRPIIATEWGFAPGHPSQLAGSVEDFGEPFARLLDEQGLHSTAWCWSPGAAPAMLERDWQRPTPFGRFVRTYLARQTSIFPSP